MDHFPQRIHRVFKPSEYDYASYAALCTVGRDQLHVEEYYVQISKNEETPEWYEVSSEEDGKQLIHKLLENA